MGITSFLQQLFHRDPTKRIRRQVRQSYQEGHLSVHFYDLPPEVGFVMSPHESGLERVLWDYYEDQARPFPFVIEVAPFLELPESEAVNVLTEYLVWKETGSVAHHSVDWLRSKILQGLRSAMKSERYGPGGTREGVLETFMSSEFRSSELAGTRVWPELL